MRSRATLVMLSALTVWVAPPVPSTHTPGFLREFCREIRSSSKAQNK